MKPIMRMFGLCLFVLSLSLTAVSGSIVADGAALEKLSGDYSFTEGPAADAEGNVYFTDQPNDRIMKWSTDGTITTYMQPCGRSNGLCVDTQGTLWACADEKNQLWRIESGPKTTIVLDAYDGKLLNGPNDLWIDPHGGIYFSDPFYQRDYWKRGPMEQECQGVYYIPPGETKVIRVIDDFEQPNGLIGTPDGKTLYVTDIQAKKTWKYAVGPDGRLSEKTLFCEMGSDGMTIDSAGNVYLTNEGVFVFDPTGTQILHIEVPEPWTANVCFGGKDKNQLFITACKGLYRMQMSVKGVGSQ